MEPFGWLHNIVDPILANFDGFLDAIQETDIVQNYAATDNFIAVVECFHVLAVGLVVGTIFFLDLRLLGFFRKMPVRQASRILPFTWWAFLLAVITGSLFFLQQPQRYIHNEAFQIKFLLMILAGINLAIFHFGIWQSVEKWDDGRSTPFPAKAAGLLSAVLWISILFYGRLVPFVG